MSTNHHDDSCESDVDMAERPIADAFYAAQDVVTPGADLEGADGLSVGSGGADAHGALPDLNIRHDQDIVRKLVESNLESLTTTSTQNLAGLKKHGDHSNWLDRFGDISTEDVGGAGNCQFLVLADALYGNTARMRDVRKAIADYMRKHESDCKIGMHDLPHSSPAYKTFDDYCSGIGNCHEWGNYTTLQACANVYGVSIQVLSSLNGGSKFPLIKPTGQSRKTIYIGHLHEVHYVALRVKETNDSGSQRSTKREDVDDGADSGSSSDGIRFVGNDASERKAARFKSNSEKFVQDWSKETLSERADSQAFWESFFRDIFGVNRRRLGAEFETRVKHTDGHRGFMDLFWRGRLLVEQKSPGKSLEGALEQATAYLTGVRDENLPQFVVACDFKRFVLIDLDTKEKREFSLADLPQNIQHFFFIVDLNTKPRVALDEKAAEMVRRLRDSLHKAGCTNNLDLIVARIIYCFFAENDRFLFPDYLFTDFIMECFTGSNANKTLVLTALFQMLKEPDDSAFRTSKDKKDKLDAFLLKFPYVNGFLFEHDIAFSLSDTSDEVRDSLLECAKVEWRSIKPEIFGAIYQGMLDSAERHEAGAHYTCQKNIKRLIGPLFLDDLKAALWELRRKIAEVNSFNGRVDYFGKLLEFREALGRLRILDPACGCANFLTVTYHELRRVDLECVIAARDLAEKLNEDMPKREAELKQKTRDRYFAGDKKTAYAASIPRKSEISTYAGYAHNPPDASNFSVVRLSSFTGYELMEHAVAIGNVALLICKQQEDRFAAYVLSGGTVVNPLPYDVNSKGMVQLRNALDGDWGEGFTHIIGNPPFLGARKKNEQQAREIQRICKGLTWSQLDYVLCWFKIACDYVRKNRFSRFAFVSTKSINQGVQKSAFQHFIGDDLELFFAWKAFDWFSYLAAARDVAQVTVIICGVRLKNERKERDQLVVKLTQANVGRPGDHAAARSKRDATVLKEDGRLTGDGFYVFEAGNKTDCKTAVDGITLEFTAVRKVSLPDNLLSFTCMSELVDVRQGWKANPATEGGLVLGDKKGKAFLQNCVVKDYVKRFVTGRSIMTGEYDYCLVFNEAPSGALEKAVLENLRLMKSGREVSDREGTKKLASVPWRFGECGEHKLPNGPCIAWGVTGQDHKIRKYHPIFFFERFTDVFQDQIAFIRTDDKFLFGLLQSAMLTAWVVLHGSTNRGCLRLTKDCVSTFPVPMSDAGGLLQATCSDAQRLRVVKAANDLLAVRRDSGLRMTVIYDTHFADRAAIRDAHLALDKAVDEIYAPARTFNGIDERMDYLRALQKQTSATTTNSQQSMNLFVQKKQPAVSTGPSQQCSIDAFFARGNDNCKPGADDDNEEDIAVSKKHKKK